jgi:hypothetical protein
VPSRKEIAYALIDVIVDTSEYRPVGLLVRTPNWQVSGLCPLEDAIDITCCLPELVE